MKKIFKYTLAPDRYLMIPKGGIPLFVGNQLEEAQIWFLVDPLQEKEARRFCVFPTGIELPDYAETYIGSFFMSGGSLVFHVFESKI